MRSINDDAVLFFGMWDRSAALQRKRRRLCVMNLILFGYLTLMVTVTVFEAALYLAVSAAVTVTFIL